MDEMERVLRWARLSEQAGPGFKLMSPERIRMILRRNEVDLWNFDG